MMRFLKTLLPQRSALRLLWHRSKAFAAALLYGFPAKKLTIIGVTGTDGKTTTVGMTAHILHASGIPVGALSTAFFRIRDSVTWNATQKTSPSPFIIQKFLRRLVKARCTHAVLEYSSHGLVQGRGNWTWPAVAAITNTSFEHLDYHGSMEQYRRDKSLLFLMTRKEGAKVLHREDETYARFLKIPTTETLTYAQHPPEYFKEEAKTDEGRERFLWVSEAHASVTGSTAFLHLLDPTDSSQTRKRELQLAIPGLFNLENAMCALSCALAVGITFDQACDALASFQGVPGRMERIEGPQSFSVFVDFTVTPASYDRTLHTLRASLEPGHKLLVLAGSCGDRMREKRPEVGRICSEYANIVVITNEDPYTEDPEVIINEVWSGIDQAKTQAHRISDRLEAMRFIFSKAEPGDIVLLCGKGSDTTMMTDKGQIPWNEREIARTLLASVGS
jgi:UDP-N-acetylmuramoyl-L-alanyl-D-glutamate--2,6-diaminopimelate ligase